MVRRRFNRKAGSLTLKKAELMEIKVLRATDKMMRLAAADTPVKNDYYRGGPIYKRGLYMRSHLHNGILKVAIFMPEFMRDGSRSALFEVFCDRDKEQFITYDCKNKRWLTSKLDRLYWMSWYCLPQTEWMKKSESDAIKSYFGVKHGGFRGVLDFQQKIREDALVLRHKKETDPWDADLKQVPALPKDWVRWVNKVGIRDNYIFYDYVKKGAVTGYCTFCEKDVPIKKPRHNKLGRCSRCRHEIVYKSYGRAGFIATRINYMYLIQRCKDGFVVREFKGSRHYKKGSYDTPELRHYEISRSIYNKNARNPRAYYKGLYKNRSYRWILGLPCSPYWIGNADGFVYGKTLSDLSTRELKQTGLREFIKTGAKADPEKYLAVLSAVPILEKLSKAGLWGLVHECLGSYYNFQEHLHNVDATSLMKALGINAPELRRPRDNNGGCRFLDWLKYEKVTNKPISDNVIQGYCNMKIRVADIQFILGRMNPLQVYNYVRRQMKINNADSATILGKWADYLSMAKRLKMDTNDEIIYRVNKLYQRHDELVERCHEKDLAIQAGEIIERLNLTVQSGKNVLSTTAKTQT